MKFSSYGLQQLGIWINMVVYNSPFMPVVHSCCVETATCYDALKLGNKMNVTDALNKEILKENLDYKD